MIFSTENNELTIFNKTITTVKDNLSSLKEAIVRKDFTSETGVRSILSFNKDKPQIIPEENLIKELSFDEAREQLEDFNKCVIDGNQSLDNYFSGARSGNTVLKDYVSNTEQQQQSTQGLVEATKNARAEQIKNNETIKQSSLAYKAQGVALKGLAMAGNMLVSWGVSKAIELAVKGIDDFIHKADYCKERVENLTSEYTSATATANANAKTVEGLANKYETLSKGVDNVGRNVSLTTSEYAEYNDIVNQVADMFPNLVNGHTAEGNAILKVKGNVEELRDAYKEAQIEAANLLITSDDGDIVENLQNTIFNDGLFKADSAANEYLDIINTLQSAMYKSDAEYEKVYKELFDINPFSTSGLQYKNNMSTWQFFNVKNTLSDLGFKAKLSDEDKKNINQQAQAVIQTYQSEIDNALKATSLKAEAFAITNENYDKLDKDIQSVISSIFHNINFDTAKNFKNETDIGAYVSKIIDSANKDEVKNSMNKLINFDFDNLPIDKAQTQIHKYASILAKEWDMPVDNVTEKFGLGDVEETYNKYLNAINSAKKDFGTDESNFFKANSINTDEEIDNWLECAKATNTAIEAEQRYLELSKKLQETNEGRHLKELWSSTDESIIKAREEIEKLGASSTITTDSIKDNLGGNAIVASMEGIGMSANFMAECLNNALDPKIGLTAFDVVTEKTINLDKALSSMDKKLEGTDEALAKYQQSMQEDDFNAQYLQYKKAIEDLKEMDKNKEYGKAYWNTANLLFGDDVYKKSISDIKKEVNGLGNYFSDNAVHVQTFFDKIIQLKSNGELDGLGISIKKLADGGYDWDIPTDSFDELAEKFGVTEELIAAFVNSMGMLSGDFFAFDTKDLDTAVKDFGVLSKKSNKTVVSLQAIKSELGNVGIHGKEFEDTIKKIKEMDDVTVLDFSVKGTKEVEALAQKLEEINAIHIDGKNIDLDEFVKNLREKLSMNDQQIKKAAKTIDENYDFTVAGEKVKNLGDALKDALSSEKKDGAKKKVDDTKKSTDKLTKSTKKATKAFGELNMVDLSNLANQLFKPASALDILKDKVNTTRKLLNSLGNFDFTNPLDVNNNIKKNNPTSNVPIGNGSPRVKVNGTAHVNGTFSNMWTNYRKSKGAYASGDWSLPQDETALINELGQEMIVRDGQWRLIPGGAHFEQLKKGDIIFNHVQTKELLSNGYVTSNNGHGKVAHATGTAHNILNSNHTAFSSGSIGKEAVSTQKHTNTSTSKSSSKKSKSSSKKSLTKSSTDKAKKDFKELFDWIEILISRTERLAKKAIDNVERYSSTAMKKHFAKEAINQQQKLIKHNESGASKYKKKADSVKLDTKWKEKVKNGTLDISTIKNEKLAESIKEYQDWYEKYLDCKDAASEAKVTLKEYAETLASIPWEQASKKIERFNSLNDILDAKLNNLSSTKAKNKVLAEQLELQQKILNAQKSAIKDEEKQQKELKKSILNSKDYKKLNAKSKKEIKESLNKGDGVSMSKVKGVSSGSKLYKDLITYNQNVKVHDNNTLEFEKQKQETISAVKENAQTIVDGIWDEAIEKIDKCKDSIDYLNNKLANTSGIKERNKLLQDQIKLYQSMTKEAKDAVQDEKGKQKTYKSSIKKSSDYKKLATNSNDKKLIDNAIKGGKTIDLSKLKTKLSPGSNLYKNITKYNSATNKIKEGRDYYNNIKEENAQAIRSAIKENFSSISKYYQNRTDNLQSKKDKIDSYINLAEAKGQGIGKSYYNKELELQERELKELQDKKSDLQKQFDKAVKSGDIEKYSDDWYEMRDAIYQCEKGIIDSQTATENLKNSIKELEWSNFDLLLTKINQAIDESNFLINLMSNEKLYDKQGNITNEGMATHGQHAYNYNSYMKQADELAAEIAKIPEDTKNKKDLERRNELIKQRQDTILAANSEKKAMLDLVNEGIQAEIKAMSELINKKKAALDVEKDLHDYKKSIEEKTKNIARIQKQINALSLDDSQENKKKLRELKAELADAQDDLAETQYSHSIEEQKKALDETLEQFTESKNKYLEDNEQVFSDTLNMINSNTGTISNTLKQTAHEVGYTISSTVSNAWNTAGNAVSNYANGFTNNTATVLQQIELQKQAVQSLIAEYEKLANWNISLVEREEKKAGSAELDKFNSSTLNNVKDSLKMNSFDKKQTQTINELKSSGKPSKQEINLLKPFKERLKEAAFSSGGVATGLNKIIFENGEDGLTAIKKGETVLTDRFTTLMPDAIRAMDNFTNLSNHTPTPIQNPTTVENKIEINVGDMPNVIDSHTFVKQLQTDTKIQNGIKEMVLSNSSCKNMFSVNRIH